MPIILPANSAASGGYEVANSLRFNAPSSDYLSRTFGSGNQKTWTWSAWIKLANIDSTSEVIFGRLTANNDSNWFTVDIRGNDKITIGIYNTNYLITNRLFRDVSAWYHIVVAFDTTQSTADNRVRLYVNGVEETSFATRNNPSLNFDAPLNANVEHLLGKSSSTYYEGYMSEVTFIDGQQLDATSFGEFDEDSGIWKPIDVSGLTFGTNGFYLDFEDSSALGNDAAGSNNWTANNLTSVDQSLDTCTNNACTWNPLRFWNRSGTLQKVSFDNGNLRAIFDDNGYNEYAFASIGVDTGKWFCEMKAEDITATANTRIGVLNMDYTGTGNPGDQSTSVSYMADGQKRVGGSNSSYGASYTNGDIIGVALDVTNNTVTFYKNGASQGAISITANTLYTFYSEDYASSGNKEISANFSSPAYAVSSGNSDANGYGNFEYAVPSGYFALNTKNLAEYG